MEVILRGFMYACIFYGISLLINWIRLKFFLHVNILFLHLVRTSMLKKMCWTYLYFMIHLYVLSKKKQIGIVIRRFGENIELILAGIQLCLGDFEVLWKSILLDLKKVLYQRHIVRLNSLDEYYISMSIKNVVFI